MEESYILVLLTILILLVVVVGYLAQKRIREIEIETNALKCDFETHVSQVNELLSVQQNGGECDNYDMNNDEIDMSKIQNIMNGNYEELSKQNEEIFKNINKGDLKCIDASDDDDESNCNEGDQLGQVELLNDSSDSEDEEQTLESDMSKLEEQLSLLDENDNIPLELNNIQEDEVLINNEKQNTEQNTEQKTENNTKQIKRTSSKKKKTPNVVASSFEEGHEVISENDGKLYRVSQYKSGNKRWVLAK